MGSKTIITCDACGVDLSGRPDRHSTYYSYTDGTFYYCITCSNRIERAVHAKPGTPVHTEEDVKRYEAEARAMRDLEWSSENDRLLLRVAEQNAEIDGLKAKIIAQNNFNIDRERQAANLSEQNTALEQRIAQQIEQSAEVHVHDLQRILELEDDNAKVEQRLTNALMDAENTRRALDAECQSRKRAYDEWAKAHTKLEASGKETQELIDALASAREEVAAKHTAVVEAAERIVKLETLIKRKDEALTSLGKAGEIVAAEAKKLTAEKEAFQKYDLEQTKKLVEHLEEIDELVDMLGKKRRRKHRAHAAVASRLWKYEERT